jgi:hypothetical protein
MVLTSAEEKEYSFEMFTENEFMSKDIVVKEIKNRQSGWLENI